MKNRILILVFLLLQAVAPFAQETVQKGNPFIRSYFPREYNQHNQNWSVVQDRMGVMYFGNGNGILEFNGKDWRLIHLKNQSRCLSLAVDRNGVIYAGGDRDFGYLSVKKNGEKTFISLLNKIPAEEKTITEVWSINATSHGIYFKTRNKIFRYYHNSIKVIKFVSAPFSQNVYDEIFVSNKNGIYVLKNDKPVLLPHTDKLNDDKAGLINILPYFSGKLLIATQKKGLYIYDLNLLYEKNILPNDFSNKNIPETIIKTFPTAFDRYSTYHNLRSGLQIHPDQYALGHTDGGIVISDRNGNLIRIINKSKGLCDNLVYSLFLDKFQNLWAVTNNGISHIEINSPVSIFNEKNGLEVMSLKAIKNKRKVYVGAFDGCYYLPDYKMNILNDKYMLKLVQGMNFECWSFADYKDHLLAGALYGLYEIKDTLSKKIYDCHSVYSIGQSVKFPDHVFLGLIDGFKTVKLNGTDKKPSGWIQANTGYENLFSEINYAIRDIQSDPDGNLWINCEFNGLILIKFFSHDISDYQLFKFDTCHGLPGIQFNKPYFRGEQLLVATEKGIYQAVFSDTSSIFSASSVHFSPCKSYGRMFYDSLPVQQITFSTSKIWIRMNQTIGYLSKSRQSGYIWNDLPFREIDGVIENIFIEDDSQSWICTNNGLFSFNLKKDKEYNVNYPALITKVVMNNDSVLFRGNFYNDSLLIDSNIVLASTTQHADIIPVLPYEFNSIVFEYSAPFFEHDNKKAFSYYLRGYEKNFSEWTMETRKEYTNLPEGSYCFAVKARNVYGYESDVTYYRFRITPPWYRTVWAYAGYVILLLALLFFGIRLNTYRLGMAKRKLEKIVKERTRELQNKNSELEKQKNEIQLKNAVLFEQKEEILTQNEEIQQQNEEIRSQKDYHEALNKELVKEKNIVEIQAEEIRTQAENLMRINEELEKLSIVAQKTENAVMIMDGNANILWINEGCVNLFHLTPEEICDKYGNNLLQISQNPDIEKIIQQCIIEKKTVIYENNTTLSNGKKLWTQTTLTPILNDMGDITRLVAIDTDITDIKKAEQEIRNNNRLITDSIKYAKRIQDAILPSQESLNKIFPESFILFKPRDIVSGDFYWFFEQKDKLYIAAVDCTGHGVPGAFMSIIGNTMLNEIVMENKTFNPGRILDQLNSSIMQAIGQRGDESMEDGMDITLCLIDRKNEKIDFAVAGQYLYIIQDNRLLEMEGDMFSIGGMFAQRNNFRFTNHSIPLRKDTMLYMFSDGFPDQFGEKESVKFSLKRFKELILNNYMKPMNEQKEILDRTFQSWKGTTRQIDDMMVVGIKL